MVRSPTYAPNLCRCPKLAHDYLCLQYSGEQRTAVTAAQSRHGAASPARTASPGFPAAAPRGVPRKEHSPNVAQSQGTLSYVIASPRSRAVEGAHRPAHAAPHASHATHARGTRHEDAAASVTVTRVAPLTSHMLPGVRASSLEEPAMPRASQPRVVTAARAHACSPVLPARGVVAEAGNLSSGTLRSCLSLCLPACLSACVCVCLSMSWKNVSSAGRQVASFLLTCLLHNHTHHHHLHHCYCFYCCCCCCCCLCGAHYTPPPPPLPPSESSAPLPPPLFRFSSHAVLRCALLDTLHSRQLPAPSPQPRREGRCDSSPSRIDSRIAPAVKSSATRQRWSITSMRRRQRRGGGRAAGARGRGRRRVGVVLGHAACAGEKGGRKAGVVPLVAKQV